MSQIKQGQVFDVFSLVRNSRKMLVKTVSPISTEFPLPSSPITFQLSHPGLFPHYHLEHLQQCIRKGLNTRGIGLAHSHHYLREHPNMKGTIYFKTDRILSLIKKLGVKEVLSSGFIHYYIN